MSGQISTRTSETVKRPTLPSVLDRALQSKGSSSHAIYSMVARVLEERNVCAETLVDVGCGSGALWSYVSNRFTSYVGVDIEKYSGFPENAQFVHCNLESYKIPLVSEGADVVIAVETIEHLENPRAFCRELTRLFRPGGTLLITTPNQLSLLSKLTLLFKNEFNAFRATNYPAHITALLEIDLIRILAECKLVEAELDYSRHGRVPCTSIHWPGILSTPFPRAFSDNFVVVSRKLT